MVALYRSGRQAEALEAYAAARRRLVDEVGVEPSAELRELQARILRQDPSLQVPMAAVETPAAEHGAVPPETEPPAPLVRGPPARRTARRRFVLAAVGALFIALVVFAVTRLTGTGRLPSIDEGAVGVVDPRAAAITTQYRTGSDSGAVAEGAGSVWVASPREGTVSRIHPEGERVETIDVGPAPAGLAFGAGSLWVASGDDGEVAQVDSAANRVVQRIPVGNGLRAVAVCNGPCGRPRRSTARSCASICARAA
jgi:streptogramin lyase